MKGIPLDPPIGEFYDKPSLVVISLCSGAPNQRHSAEPNCATHVDVVYNLTFSV